MFEVFIIEAESYGNHEYVTHKGYGMSKSPKKASEAAIRGIWDSYAKKGSGVPVFRSVTIKKDGKVISESY